MASLHPPHRHERNTKALPIPPASSEDVHYDVSSLVEENAQLRELVIQLSKLVIKNVVDSK